MCTHGRFMYKLLLMVQQTLVKSASQEDSRKTDD
jgi:hypothetical protein